MSYIFIWIEWNLISISYGIDIATWDSALILIYVYQMHECDRLYVFTKIHVLCAPSAMDLYANMSLKNPGENFLSFESWQLAAAAVHLLSGKICMYINFKDLANN